MATEVNLQNDDVTVNTLTGNGSGLTNLNATNISSGTLNATRLPFSVLDEDNMASNSATDVPSQQSVKAYTDANAGGGGGITPEIAKTYLFASSINNATTTYEQESIFPSNFNQPADVNVGGFTTISSGISVPSTGVYLVSATLNYTSIIQRANPEFRFSINSTGQSESSLSSYIRALDGHNEVTSSLVTLYSLTAGDRIGIQIRAAAATGTVQLLGPLSDESSHITIYRVA